MAGQRGGYHLWQKRRTKADAVAPEMHETRVALKAGVPAGMRAVSWVRRRKRG